MSINKDEVKKAVKEAKGIADDVMADGKIDMAEVGFMVKAVRSAKTTTGKIVMGVVLVVVIAGSYVAFSGGDDPQPKPTTSVSE